MNTNNKKITNFNYLRSVSKGNASFEQKMLNTFIQQCGADVKKLKQAMLYMDWETINMIAHKIRPSLQFVGLDLLSGDAQALETLAKQKQDPEKVAELISGISTMVEIAIEEIKDELITFKK